MKHVYWYSYPSYVNCITLLRRTYDRESSEIWTLEVKTCCSSEANSRNSSCEISSLNLTSRVRSHSATGMSSYLECCCTETSHLVAKSWGILGVVFSIRWLILETGETPSLAQRCFVRVKTLTCHQQALVERDDETHRRKPYARNKERNSCTISGCHERRFKWNKTLTSLLNCLTFEDGIDGFPERSQLHKKYHQYRRL